MTRYFRGGAELSPIDLMPKEKTYGTYCICRCLNHDRHGEMTNVGVSLYDSDGLFLGARADDTARAVARGDLTPFMAEAVTKQYVLASLSGYASLADLERHQQNFSYAMSCVQVQRGGVTLIEPITLDKLFERIVLGKRS